MANKLEPTKKERRSLIEIIKNGNLVRYREWLDELDTLIHKPYSEEEYKFDRCMEITKKSRDFFKETMTRESFYRNTQPMCRASILLHEKDIEEKDLDPLSDEIKNAIILWSKYYKD